MGVSAVFDQENPLSSTKLGDPLDVKGDVAAAEIDRPSDDRVASPPAGVEVTAARRALSASVRRFLYPKR